ncbi:MAG: phage portal protein [Rhodomicrobium sp.]
MKLNLGRLTGLRDAAADMIRSTVQAIRPKAAAASPGSIIGWEALTYGNIYPSPTGIEISPYSALRCPPVYAAIKVLSESVAQIPLHMHAKGERGSLGRELNHPLADLLGDMPNPEITMFEFRQMLEMWRDLWGNAYAWIVRDYRGQVAELWPIRPEWVAVTENPAFPLQPIYTVTAPDNSSHLIHRGDIVHLRTFGTYPYRGDSPVMWNRETIAQWLVVEQHISRFFGRGARPAGVLETQKVLSPEATANLRTQLDSTHGGTGTSQTLVLEEGMKWTPSGQSFESSQLIELRKQQMQEVCRIWRIPPLLMQDPEKTIGSTAETLGRWFVTYTLSPLLDSWTQALSISLLTREERRQYFLLHDLTEFERAESQTRWQAYVAAVTNGIFNVNEVRGMESMEPIEGGDTFRVPLNTGPATGATNQYHGQNSHVTDPTQTLLGPLKTGHARRPLPPQPQPSDLQQSRDRLERYLARSPERLRLTAPPKGVSNRPRAGAIEVNPTNEDSGHATS